MTTPILIAGAGIAGLATALALKQRGIDSVVLERRAQLSDEGAGIQLGPNGMAVLAHLGLRAALAPAASAPDYIQVYTAGGRALTRLPLGAWIEARHGHPYWVVHRRDLMRVLHDAVQAAGIVIRLGVEVGAVEMRADGVAMPDATLSGRGMIGADGIWSATRAAHFDATPPTAAGKAAARVLIDATRVPASMRGVVSVWMAPDAHLVAYPVQQGRQLNIVLIAPAVSVSDRWSNDVSPDEIAARADAMGGLGSTNGCSARDLLGAVTAADRWQQWPLVTRAPLDRYAKGRVALVGDAAHPMLPFLAQGAVMALEDALWMARCLAAAKGDIEQGFRAYEAARLARTRRVVAAAARNGQMYHVSGALAAARNATLRAAPGALVMRGYDWLYGAGVTNSS